MASHLPLSLNFIHYQVMSILPPKSILKPASDNPFCSYYLSRSHYYHLSPRLLRMILTGVPTFPFPPNPIVYFPYLLCPSLSSLSLPAQSSFCAQLHWCGFLRTLWPSVYLHMRFLLQILSYPLTFWQTPT